MKEKPALFSAILFNKRSRAIAREEYSLSSFSFFTRNSVQEMIRFISKRLVDNIETSVYQEFHHQFDDGPSYKFSLKETGEHIIVVSTVTEYPPNTIKLFISDVAHEKAPIKELMRDYQDYKNKDIFAQIQVELAQTESILTKTVESALGRGEKIDDLINSADSLSFQTKSLYRLSKKQNKRCCGIM